MTAFILKVAPKGFAGGWVVDKRENEPSLSDWENEGGWCRLPSWGDWERKRPGVGGDQELIITHCALISLPEV